MTDKITVPRETWDAMMEALVKISSIENRDWGTDWEEIEEARGIAKAALTAANAVSEPKGLFVDLIASHGPEFVAEVADVSLTNEGDMPQATEPAWRPIESAPKDGSEILLANPDGSCAVGWFKFRGHTTGWTDGDIFNMTWPTHWRPLPAAPEAKQ